MLASPWVNDSARWNADKIPLPVKDSNCIEDRKDHHSVVTRSRNPNTFAYCVLVLELSRKAKRSSIGWNNTFLHIEETQNKISSNCICESLMAGCSLQQPLPLAKEVSQAQRPFLSGQEGVKRRCTWDCPSQQNVVPVGMIPLGKTFLWK